MYEVESEAQGRELKVFVFFCLGSLYWLLHEVCAPGARRNLAAHGQRQKSCP